MGSGALLLLHMQLLGADNPAAAKHLVNRESGPMHGEGGRGGELVLHNEGRI
jgi:hypothetical protein